MADDQEDIVSQNVNESPSETDQQPKVTLDTGKIGAPSGRSLQKVELDLDDAVFLDVEDDEEEASSQPQDPLLQDKHEEPGQRQPKQWNYKKIIIFAGIAFVCIAIIISLWMLLRPEPEAPPPAPIQNKKTTSPPRKEPPELTEHVMAFDPFWVEFNVNGTNRFLTCRFSFPVKGDLLQYEVNRKRIIIRDAVYYYFKNKDLVFLANKNNGDKLKSDLLEIINQYLGNGQLEEILIQEYRVQ
ncbi:flagellar basal body-associated FliL family protein [Desulfoplanes formicivorans]|uniref:Flagellar protein FliL n=1 Tax=Desulfoplanes formicivorans TaxID=1592317 RepID=A0A194AJ06_9BACT|nr:flagellar basal body-associated FliL family protein [Desulfoplanes formicivorans]GAU09051.1 flagellar basal body-associated protein FliL [Desulfoplanes formicivorans]